MWRLVLFLGCAVTGAFAETFQFNNLPMPETGKLQGHYVFHVVADAVGTQVLDTSAASAAVTFKNFELKWSDGKVGIGNDQGIEVLLIPLRKLTEWVNKSYACNSGRPMATFNRDADNVCIFNPAEQKEVTVPIKATDAYLLTVANCGKGTGATLLKGQVTVKQAHGYLPGNKVWSFHWWRWFTVVNAFLCVIWIVAAGRHRNALMNVHAMITWLAFAAPHGGSSFIFSAQGMEQLRISAPDTCCSGNGFLRRQVRRHLALVDGISLRFRFCH